MERIKILMMVVYNESMNEVFEEIGNAIITAHLRENGYEVMMIQANEKRIDYDKIAEFNPGLVGLTTFAVSKNSVYNTVKKIKERVHGARFCLGGFFPSFYDVELLEENPDIDFVGRGEGERIMLNLANCLSEGKGFAEVKGLTYRDGDQIIQNEDEEVIRDLDSLPFASRDALVDNGLKHALISTSRACVHGCSFCISRSFWREWRGKSPENIVAEIKHVVENYGISSFDIVDSSFEDPDVNYERLQAIVQGILDANLSISYYVNMRADFVRKATPELMEMLKKSGMCGVFLGIETNNDEDRKLYNKTASTEDSIKAVQLFREYNIGVSIGFINFNPYSTFAGLRKNIDFLEEYNFARSFNAINHRFLAYNKHTSMYNKLKNDGLLKESDNPYYLDYNFVDPRVKEVADFVKGFFVQARKENPTHFSTIDFYNYIHINTLCHYIRLFEMEQHQDALQVVLEHDTNIKEIFKNLSNVNAEWFRKLLDLGENGWDANQAQEIMSNALSGEFLANLVTELNGEKRAFFKKMLALGEEYAKYL